MMELPYYNNNNNNNNNVITKRKKKNKKKWSYGIICVSLEEGYMVINKSLPYIKSQLIENSNNNGYNTLNTNEKYNITLNMFPNTTLEGEYTLPKGKIDVMDQNNTIYTKLREFIEETKLTHPDFSTIANNHYAYPDTFQSFLNDKNNIVRESWMGLNGVTYYCEYSVFVIQSLKELVPISDVGVVPFNYFLQNFAVYKNSDKYYKRYSQSSILDRHKTTYFVPIYKAIQLLNEHKINNNTNNVDSRLKLTDIITAINKKI